MAPVGSLKRLPDPPPGDDTEERLAEASDLFSRLQDGIDALVERPRHLVTACDLLLQAEARLTGLAPEDRDFFLMLLRHSVLNCGGIVGSVTRLREQLQDPELKVLLVGKEADRTAAAEALECRQGVCGLGGRLSITKLHHLPANIFAMTPCAFVFALQNDQHMEQLVSGAKEAYDDMINRRSNPSTDLFVDEDSFLFVFSRWNHVESVDEVLGKIQAHFPLARVNKNVFFLRKGADIEARLAFKNAVLNLVPRALQADQDRAFFWLQEVVGALRERLHCKMQAVRNVYDEAEHGWRTMCSLIGEEPTEHEAVEKTLCQLRTWKQELVDSFRDEELTRFAQEFLDFLRSREGLEELGRVSEADLPNCRIFEDVIRVVLFFSFDRLKVVFKAWNTRPAGVSRLQALRERLSGKCRETFSVIQQLFPRNIDTSPIQIAFVQSPNGETQFLSVIEEACRVGKVMPKVCSSSVTRNLLCFASNMINSRLRQSYQSNKTNFTRIRLKTFVNEMIHCYFLKKDFEQMISLSTLEKEVNLWFDKSRSLTPTRIRDIIKTKHSRKMQLKVLHNMMKLVHVFENHLNSHYYEHIKHYEFRLPSSELDTGTFPATLLNKNFDEPLAAWSTVGVRQHARLLRMREVAWHKLGLSKTCHRNVLRFLGCLRVNEEIFFVSESYTGNLKDHLQSTAMLRMKRSDRETQVRNIGTQIATGLKHVHASGLVAHEFSPENILFRNIRDSIEIKLFCFGSKMEVSTESFLKVVQGSWKKSNRGGTNFMDYASPETQTWNICTPLSNVYTSGLILVDLFCGISARRETSGDFHAMVEERVVQTADFPEYLKNLIIECTVIEATQRPTVDGILTALSSQ